MFGLLDYVRYIEELIRYIEVHYIEVLLHTFYCNFSQT